MSSPQRPNLSHETVEDLLLRDLDDAGPHAEGNLAHDSRIPDRGHIYPVKNIRAALEDLRQRHGFIHYSASVKVQSADEKDTPEKKPARKPGREPANVGMPKKTINVRPDTLAASPTKRKAGALPWRRRSYGTIPGTLCFEDPSSKEPSSHSEDENDDAPPAKKTKIMAYAAHHHSSSIEEQNLYWKGSVNTAPK